ncbi:hypothetical protein [Solidesulfovibrio magneticus]|nr:hypothetical protein [Solidesulfovibrio magneticus]
MVVFNESCGKIRQKYESSPIKRRELLLALFMTRYLFCSRNNILCISRQNFADKFNEIERLPNKLWHDEAKDFMMNCPDFREYSKPMCDMFSYYRSKNSRTFFKAFNSVDINMVKLRNEALKDCYDVIGYKIKDIGARQAILCNVSELSLSTIKAALLGRVTSRGVTKRESRTMLRVALFEKIYKEYELNVLENLLLEYDAIICGDKDEQRSHDITRNTIIERINKVKAGELKKSVETSFVI